jgi:hypothetical protein
MTEELKLKWEAPTKLTRKSLDGYYYLEKIHVGYGCRAYANTKFFGIYSNLIEAKEACERDRITSAKLEAERPEPTAEEVEIAWLRSTIETLLAAKAEKEVNGKTDKYIKLRDRGWEMAKESMKD